MKSIISVMGNNIFNILFIGAYITLSNGKSICPTELRSWATDNLDIIKNNKLSELSFPGSHDAAMYTFDECAAECSTRTQELSIYDQLLCGVRFLDIRPVYESATAELWTGHFSEESALGIVGCLGPKMDVVFDDILKYTKDYPNELIFVEFFRYLCRYNYIYDMEECNDINIDLEPALKALVEHKLGQYLIDPSINLMDLTYSEILKHGSVIVRYVNSQKTSYSKSGSYAEKNDFDQMKNDQFGKLKNEGVNTDELYQLYWTLTASTSQAVLCIFDPEQVGTNNIHGLTALANVRLNDIIIYQNEINKISNIIWSDFHDGSASIISVKTNGISTTNYGDIICEAHRDCANLACARKTAAAADSDTFVCCPSGVTYLYNGYYYCYGLENGDICLSDAMCESGNCKDEGDTNVCRSKASVNSKCAKNSNCENNACASATAASDAELICCPSNYYGWYNSHAYCYGMSDGDECWSDAMCASNHCTSNYKCLTPLPVNSICITDGDCANNHCAHGSASSNADLICCPSNEYGLYNSYWYCYGMSDGTECWSDAMCANRCGSDYKCFSPLPVYSSCSAHSDCENNSCAWGTAYDDWALICCPSGNYDWYLGYAYCYGVSNGDNCKSHSMCASNDCGLWDYEDKKWKCQ